MRLPAAPILRVLERAAVQQGYIGSDPDVNGGAGFQGLRSFAESLGVCGRTYERIKAEGVISLGVADLMACALGLHPLLIWPQEYDEWMGEPVQDPERPWRQGRRHYARRDKAGNWLPCEICGQTNRYPDGHCRVCHRRQVNRRYRRQKEAAA